MTWDEDAWTDYATATRRLDQLRRDAAAAVVRQQEAAVAEQDRVAEIRDRVSAQRLQFADAASRFSMSPPILEPMEADRAGVTPPGPDCITDITAAVDDASTTLDDAESTLSSIADRPARTGLLGGWPAPLRNAVVYLWYAALAMVATVEIDHISGPSTRPRVVVAAFSVALPLLAWAVGWLSVGMLFAGDRSRRRSAWLGSVICAVPLVIGLILAQR